MRRWIPFFFALVALTARASAEDVFAVQVIETTERTVVAEIADLDGDARSDLLQIVFSGAPPDETRRIRVFFQQENGAIPGQPDLDIALPAEAAAFDLANVLAGRGTELLLLSSEGVTIVSFEPATPGRKPGPEDVSISRALVPDGPTVGAEQDERGLDKLEMASFAFGDEPRLIVPAFGETFVLSPQGAVRARVQVGGRANYIIAPPGPVLAESDVQLFYDASRIFVGDVNGDGRADIVGSSRHELRVFFGREDGSYPNRADERIWLRLVTEEDHIRGSGAVRTGVRDIDGDGLLDLLITKSSGSILDARATSSIFLNRGGKWNLDAPDGEVSVKEALSSDQLLDVTGDGRLELVQIVFPISVLELIEMFFARALDAHFKVFALEPHADTMRLARRPLVSKNITIPLDFSTGRPHGFIPTLDFDFNADRVKDYLSSTDGDAIEVMLGGRSKPYGRRDGRQALETVGRVRAGDLDGDGITDLVLYNPRVTGSKVFLLRNLGKLPGTPARPPEMRPRS